MYTLKEKLLIAGLVIITICLFICGTGYSLKDVKEASINYSNVVIERMK